MMSRPPAAPSAVPVALQEVTKVYRHGQAAADAAGKLPADHGPLSRR